MNAPLVLLLLLIGLVHCDDTIIPTAVIEVFGDPNVKTIYAEPSSGVSAIFPARSSDDAPKLRLVLADPPDGCTPLKNSEPGEYALMIFRGTCSFSEKAHHAQKAGAGGVLILDTVKSDYVMPKNATVPVLSAPAGGACLVQCDWSRSIVTDVSEKEVYSGYPNSACATSSSCPSHLCGLTGKSSNVKGAVQHEICCLPDKYIDMAQNGSAVTIPVVFIGASDALVLQKSSQSKSLVIQISMRPIGWGSYFSAFLIWLLGMSVEACACYYSARAERRANEAHAPARAGVRRPKTPPPPALEVTITTSLIYLLFASVFLVALFFLIRAGARYVVLFIIAVFCLAAVVNTHQMLLHPFFCRYFPALSKKGIRISDLPLIDYAGLIAAAIAVSLACFWFASRHSSYAWFLQDFFAVLMCFQFLCAVRLSSIKVSVVLLCCFMLYDVFMVFLSPLIFKKSVMVEVATAGQGYTAPSTSNPLECLRVPDEHMPMLFMVPRLSWTGGYAMLGLGDVLLPGLLVSFACRYDTLCQRGSQTARGLFKSYPYFCVLCAGYGFGLLLAFLANTLGISINGVHGQPALLYLVPCTLIPFTFLAFYRKEMGVLWNGPDFKRALSSKGSENMDMDDQSEQRPLVDDGVL